MLFVTAPVLLNAVLSGSFKHKVDLFGSKINENAQFIVF